MNFNKDQIQKLILGALLLIGVVYCYFSMLLGPLAKRQAAAQTRMAELTPKIEEARKQIKRSKQLEVQAPETAAVLDSINALIPDGSPIAWFPPRLADFFKRQGLDKVGIRLANEAQEKDLPGYRRLVWTIDLPKVEFVSLAIAVAGLENEEPLLEITTVQIDAIKDDPQYQHVLLSIGNITRQ